MKEIANHHNPDYHSNTIMQVNRDAWVQASCVPEDGLG